MIIKYLFLNNNNNSINSSNMELCHLDLRNIIKLMNVLNINNRHYKINLIN